MTAPMDAVVVGAGPNGLAAAIVIAETGRRVLVFEAQSSPGGGARSAELTLPGYRHDVCSAAFAFSQSPFFDTQPLADHGLHWIEPRLSLAHPFDDRPAATVGRSVEQTAASLGDDADRYRRLMAPIVADWPKIEPAVLGARGWPRHPIAAARFGLMATGSALGLVRRRFGEPPARALLAGIAAHGMVPLERAPSAGFGLVLGALGHVSGWVLPRGGAQRITDALVARLRSLGGEIVTGRSVRSLDELPPARTILCDLSPRPFLALARHRLPRSYVRALERYRYGPAVFKVDWALDGPIPWRDRACARAGTVHLGGRWREIAAALRQVWAGEPADRPFVLLVQPTIADPTRAPAGRHVAWAYCHVPHASSVDMLSRIEAQIERFAPGFRARVLDRATTTPADLERRNPNFVGGDIGAGLASLRQMIARPTWRTHATPVRGLYLCSASTPPGVGVHGMCGWHAARRALAGALRD